MPAVTAPLRPKVVVQRGSIRKFAPDLPITLTADGAIPIDLDRTFLLSKSSAGAFTVAAPGAKNIGRKLVLLTGTDFAHVTTFTGTTLQDGTAGANSTWTATAVQGCALTVRAVSATKWNVESFNLGTIAP